MTFLDDLSELHTLRESHAALAARNEQLEPLANVVLQEGWGELVNPREYLYDTPGFGTEGDWPWGAVDLVSDRERGKCRPHFDSEQDLARQRAVARYLAGTDETSIGLLENLTNYILGTGFEYTAEPKAGDEQLAATVQAVIDEWQESHGWRRVEREAFVRSRRDGEAFLKLDHTRGGLPRPRFIEPAAVKEPADLLSVSEYLGNIALDWAFGCGSHPYDVDDVHAYHVVADDGGATDEIIEAERCEHIKCNVDSGVKRGISDFYSALDELNQSSKLARNTAQGAAIQATIAYIKEAATGTSKAQIESSRTSRADWTHDVPTPDGGSKTVRHERFMPGRVISVSGQKFTYGPMGQSAAPVFIDVLQMVLRRIGQRWNMPEYMISGDASNANFSSTLVAESPFVKAAESWQSWYAEAFESLHWKMLRCAWQAGRFGRGIPFSDIRRAVRIDIEPPRVSVRNAAEETARRERMHAAGLLSKQTWAAMEGLDYETEVKNGVARRQASPPAGPDADPLRAAVAGALESVETSDEARAILEALK